MAYYLPKKREVGLKSFHSESDPHPNIRDVFKRAFGDESFDESPMRLFAHVHKTYNILNTVNEDFLRPYNLTSAKFRILMWLLACDKIGYNDGLLPSQLSRFQGVSPNTTTSLLHGLEEQKLVHRVKHPTDNRKHIITITDEGRKVIDEVGPRYMEFTRRLSEGLSTEENQILVTLLNKLSHGILDVCEMPQDKTPVP